MVRGAALHPAPARDARAGEPALGACLAAVGRPADSVTIPEPPTTLRLDFNEPVSPLVMRLINPAGQMIALTKVVTAEQIGHHHSAGHAAARAPMC